MRQWDTQLPCDAYTGELVLNSSIAKILKKPHLSRGGAVPLMRPEVARRIKNLKSEIWGTVPLVKHK